MIYYDLSIFLFRFFLLTYFQVTSNNAKYIPHQSSTTSTSNAGGGGGGGGSGGGGSGGGGTSLSNGISDAASVSQQQQLQQNLSDKICFNFGKELYVYSYRGVKKVS